MDTVTSSPVTDKICTPHQLRPRLYCAVFVNVWSVIIMIVSVQRLQAASLANASHNGQNIRLHPWHGHIRRVWDVVMKKGHQLVLKELGHLQAEAPGSGPRSGLRWDNIM